jgi:hypothetical protein
MERRQFVRRGLLGSSAFLATGLSNELLSQEAEGSDKIFIGYGPPLTAELFIPADSLPFEKGKTVYLAEIKARTDGMSGYQIQEKRFSVVSVTAAGAKEVTIDEGYPKKRCNVTQVRCDGGSSYTGYRPTDYIRSESIWSIPTPLIFNYLVTLDEDPPAHYVKLVSGKDASGNLETTVLATSSFRHGESMNIGCFVTTACVEVLGMEDNCHDLQSLRKLRDEYVLLKRPDGRDWVALYGILGPALIRHLDRQEDSVVIYQKLYRELVQETTRLVDRGRYPEAFAHYSEYLAAFARSRGF